MTKSVIYSNKKIEKWSRRLSKCGPGSRANKIKTPDFTTAPVDQSEHDNHPARHELLQPSDQCKLFLTLTCHPVTHYRTATGPIEILLSENYWSPGQARMPHFLKKKIIKIVFKWKKRRGFDTATLVQDGRSRRDFSFSSGTSKKTNTCPESILFYLRSYLLNFII